MIPKSHMLDYELFGLSVDHDRLRDRMGRIATLRYHFGKLATSAIDSERAMFEFGNGADMYNAWMVRRLRTWDLIGGARPRPNEDRGFRMTTGLFR